MNKKTKNELNNVNEDTKIDKKSSNELENDKNFKDKTKVEKNLKRIKSERNLTDDEIVEINKLLEKIDSSEKKIILNRKGINRKTVFHVIRKIFFSYLLYVVVYFAMFGLFSKWFEFKPRYLIAYVTLGYAGYMVLFRYICRLITEKTHHYISIYNVFSLIFILVIYESGNIISGYSINGFFSIVFFYYISEIIITALRQYLFKYLPSKLMWRNKK